MKGWREKKRTGTKRGKEGSSLSRLCSVTVNIRLSQVPEGLMVWLVCWEIKSLVKENEAGGGEGEWRVRVCEGGRVRRT